MLAAENQERFEQSTARVAVRIGSRDLLQPVESLLCPLHAFSGELYSHLAGVWGVVLARLVDPALTARAASSRLYRVSSEGGDGLAL